LIRDRWKGIKPDTEESQLVCSSSMENVKTVEYGWTKTKPMKIKGELLASTPTAKKFKREKITLREKSSKISYCEDISSDTDVIGISRSEKLSTKTSKKQRKFSTNNEEKAKQLQKVKKDSCSRKPCSEDFDKSNEKENLKKKVFMSTTEEDLSSKSLPQFKQLSYLAQATVNVKRQSTVEENPPKHSHEESDSTSQENTSTFLNLHAESSDQTSQAKRIIETKGFEKPTGLALRAVPLTSDASTKLKKSELPFHIAVKSRSKNGQYIDKVTTTLTEASMEDEDMDVGVDNGITIDGLFTPVVIRSDEVSYPMN